MYRSVFRGVGVYFRSGNNPISRVLFVPQPRLRTCLGAMQLISLVSHIDREPVPMPSRHRLHPLTDSTGSAPLNEQLGIAARSRQGRKKWLLLQSKYAAGRAAVSHPGPAFAERVFTSLESVNFRPHLRKVTALPRL